VLGTRGQQLMQFNAKQQMSSVLRVDGPTLVHCRLENCRLLPDLYQLRMQLRTGKRLIDQISSGIQFKVLPRDVYGTGKLPTGRWGCFAPEVKWSAIPLPTVHSASESLRLTEAAID
jgi:hypothetical protein